MHQIEQKIYCEDSYFGVTLGALIFPHGTIMIDAPLRGEDARSWRAVMNNYRLGANRLLICLDAHPDRSLGARAMETTLVTHKNAAQVFRDRPTIFKGQGSETGSLWEIYGEAIGMRWVIPDITFTLKFSLHWGETEVLLSHQPGPTAGSIWVEIPDKQIVFIGDAVVPNQPPFLANADLDTWLERLDNLLKSYGDYVIVSSRGGVIAKDDIKMQRDFLNKVVRGMQRLAKRNSHPESTESLVPRLLSNFKGDQEYRELFEHRLRYGLQRCYQRSYYVDEDLDDDSEEDT
jgi:glyoxylase-like metal-dependent hydrolase (beta-lactamase superfamily II)